MNKGFVELLNNIDIDVSNKEIITTVDIPLMIDTYIDYKLYSRSHFNECAIYDVVDYLNQEQIHGSIANKLNVDSKDVDISISKLNNLELIVYSDDHVAVVDMFSTIKEIEFYLTLYVIPTDINYVLWIDKNRINIIS